MSVRWAWLWRDRAAVFDPQSYANIPEPVDEEPPADQFCDLVLNGGVASGVVYPWALVGLARHYRFRHIGGNSVGAVAATVAAAAEYGRCHGVHRSFEALRRMPADLAQENERGEALMLRLFQPRRPVRRLFKLFVLAVQRYGQPVPPDKEFSSDVKGGVTWLFRTVATVYGWWLPLCLVLIGSPVAAWLLARVHGWLPLQALAGGVALLAVGLALVALLAVLLFLRDLRALADNDYGLCPGNSQDGRSEALVEWMHRGVQLSAGRGEDDPPLSFAELWAAPRGGRPGPGPRPDGGPPDEPGIGLTMFTSNVTQGRPVRLPLDEPLTRLYYLPEEWARIFPPALMRALDRIAVPYAPRSGSDDQEPPPVRVGPHAGGPRHEVPASALRELPTADMPIVVAARLSLCFPLLFELVPVYAMDYETSRPDKAQASSADAGPRRALRRCLLADGGLCANFPVHLFDRAHPRWPTFALLLDRRLQDYKDDAIWLPETHREGQADNWQREVPGAEKPDPNTGRIPERGAFSRLLGVVLGMVLTMKDWNDRVAGRLPIVRNRVLRIALKRGEGQLNIAMRGDVIMRIAHRYGTRGADRLLKRFAPQADGRPSRGWQEQTYVRAVVELRALRRHLARYTEAVRSRSTGQDLAALLDEATRSWPLTPRYPRSTSAPDPTQQATGDPAGRMLTTSERDALLQAVQAVSDLEARLTSLEDQFGPYRAEPMPELRLRPPI
ncbi:hypothetical protein KAK06_13340 [Ideonella sp. 4Y11]|uniref:PNPLA domain-containing protein n=1 Tax=Ideonella aquatica TaxID=2824119 RepID=A0A940YL12_9BURK|nr:hypothetical protein [Ideonella aquatica]MBQ0959931.1 hypothetical protein [Ideonella aquatica]